MRQLALSYFEHPLIMIIPLIIFLVFFIYLLFVVMKKNNKKVFEEYSQIPLKDEEDVINEQSEK